MPAKDDRHASARLREALLSRRAAWARCIGRSSIRAAAVSTPVTERAMRARDEQASGVVPLCNKYLGVDGVIGLRIDRNGTLLRKRC